MSTFASAGFGCRTHVGHMPVSAFKATFYLTISMRGQRATGKLQRNNYNHGSCGPSVTGKTSSVIFTHRTNEHEYHTKTGFFHKCFVEPLYISAFTFLSNNISFPLNYHTYVTYSVKVYFSYF